MNELDAIDTNPVREADAMRITQQFIAGMRRDSDNPVAKRTTEMILLILHFATFSRPFHGLDSQTTASPSAINRWAIFDSPLRGLAVPESCHRSS